MVFYGKLLLLVLSQKRSLISVQQWRFCRFGLLLLFFVPW